MVAGVCGGLARWLGWDSTAVRILYVLISIFSAGFPGTIVYVILALVMPADE
jgi:phage shock protein PspC (stress-responsive transcriptional regulator)